MLGRPGLAVAFLWGLAEATFSLLSGRSSFVRRDARLAFDMEAHRCALAGALLGGALLFHWAQADPEAAHAAVARVPFITPGMFAKVNSGFDKMGLLAVLSGSVSGITLQTLRGRSTEDLDAVCLSAGHTAGARGAIHSGVDDFRGRCGWLRRNTRLQLESSYIFTP